MKLKHLTLLIILCFSTQTIFIGKADAQQNGGGPRVDNLLIKLYPTFEAEIQAFESNRIDFLDSPLNSTLIAKYSTSPWSTTVSLNEVSELAMIQIDINNNHTSPTYPDWSSPTSYQAFRHALAHLADKSAYMNEILGGHGEVLNTPVMPWMTKWYNSLADTHTYNRTETAIILDAGGFADSNGDGLRDYPSDHLKFGENLDFLVFFAPLEDPTRLAVAQRLTSEMLMLGIPVNLTITDWFTIFNIVINAKDFHLYVGKQDMYHSDVSSDTASTSFGNLYHSEMYGTYGANYVHFSNSQFDSYVETMWQASNETTAITAAKEAQRILSEQVGVIPLFATVGYKAHKAEWVQVVNESGNGVDNWWTFVLAHQKDLPTGGTLRYGIVGDLGGINPLLSDLHQLPSPTGLIYDSLLRVRDLEWIVSGVAKTWEVGTWPNPDTGANSTKLTFYLNENFYFHDGVQLTSADVNFTIGYLKQNAVGTYYPKVMDVHHVETPNPYTVVVYENITSIWALHWIGSLPILPKHKWETITDPYTSTPEPTLTGSGPFKFVEYVSGSHISLTANRNYPLHDIAIVEVSTFPESLVVGQPVYINVTVQNQRNFTEVLSVSVYYTKLIDPLIGTQIITLEPGANTTLTFNWTPDSTGRYEILAQASRVASEVDTADNSLTKIVFVGDGSAGQQNSNSNLTSLNSVAIAFGLFSSVLIIPELLKRRRTFNNNVTPLTHNQFANLRENVWQEWARRQPL